MALTMREPCHRLCDVEWCSYDCFMRRGYVPDWHRQKWIRDENGEPMRTSYRQCDWEPKKEKYEEEVNS